MSQAPAETEIDPESEEDSAAVEIAIGIAIAEALSHPPDARTMDAHAVESILEAAVGTTLRFYAQRVLTTMARMVDAGSNEQPEPSWTDPYAPIESAVDSSVRQAIDDTGETVRDLVNQAAARARNPAVRADVIEQGRGDPEVEALDRLRVGMASIARILTTRTREEAKFAYATAVGATGHVWRTRRDPKVRNSHGDLEGEYVKLGDPFRTVTGHAIRRPGDPSAPLSETINCRCRLSYRMAPV